MMQQHRASQAGRSRKRKGNIRAPNNDQPHILTCDQSAASAFDSSGSIGKQFTTEGAIGGTAQQVGGPFDKDGMIGKQFKEDGSIGGTAQQMLGDQGKQ